MCLLRNGKYILLSDIVYNLRIAYTKDKHLRLVGYLINYKHLTL